VSHVLLLCTRDPEWADVKLAQARYLLLQIVKFQHNLSGKLGSNPLVLVCGDYNSTPGDQVRWLSVICALTILSGSVF
jgi:hypothetical protein